MALYQRVKEEWEKSLRFKSSKSHEKEKSSSSVTVEKNVKIRRGRK